MKKMKRISNTDKNITVSVLSIIMHFMLCIALGFYFVAYLITQVFVIIELSGTHITDNDLRNFRPFCVLMG